VSTNRPIVDWFARLSFLHKMANLTWCHRMIVVSSCPRRPGQKGDSLFFAWSDQGQNCISLARAVCGDASRSVHRLGFSYLSPSAYVFVPPAPIFIFYSTKSPAPLGILYRFVGIPSSSSRLPSSNPLVSVACRL